jgi:hypothetical protein
VKSYAPAEFWQHYNRLPSAAQKLADKTFAFFKRDPLYPSLHFKEIRKGIWSVRIGDHYRALAKRRPDGWMWFWIGTHEEYNKLVKRVR